MEFGPVFRSMLRNRARSVLIVAEIALTLAIVVNAINAITDARAQMGRPSGFEDDSLIFISWIAFDDAYAEDGYVKELVDADLQALEAMPEVLHAVRTPFLPWAGGGSSTERRPLNSEGPLYRTQTYSTYGDIVATLGIDVVEGRNFTEQDYQAVEDDGNRTILITKAYADLVFPKGDAVGQFLQARDPSVVEKIIGIIDPFYNPYPWPIEEYAKFRPALDADRESGAEYLVRVKPGALDAVYNALEDRLLESREGRNISVWTIDELKGEFFTSQRVLMGSMGAVIVLLVFITSLGILGLTSFAVTQRTRQIGTRRALGATKLQILRFFLLENWMVTTTGILFGAVAGVVLNMVLVTYVDMVPIDWSLLVEGAVLLWVACLLAALIPALRGARISPAIATRNV